jgi:L-alanine-DL-glutamate epimerase-like enolase superfamily enzyme
MSGRHRIAAVETFLVPPGWLLVRVETDTGVVGWGEAGAQTRARTIATAIDELTGLAIGHDAAQIERLWQRLTRSGFYRGGAILSAAVAGIDEALWDIAGKVHDCPVHELLGGAVRDRQWVYCWVGGGGGEPRRAGGARRRAAGERAHGGQDDDAPAVAGGPSRRDRRGRRQRPRAA